MQVASVRCAAEMQALFEKARADALHEGRADPDALVRLEGASNRAVRRLGIDRPRAPASGPSLSDLMSRHR
jgi:hypothetical protein